MTPDEVPFLDLRRGWAELGPEAGAAVERVLASGRYVLGEEVAAFEREFAAACGARWCVGVGNGFDALTLVLRAWEIGPGDEVLVPALTAIATWMAVAATGARPVAVDVGLDSLGMDPECLARAAGTRARAVIPVHLHGIPVDIDGVRRVARERGLRVLEDGAQAAGASWRGRPVGSLADAAAFSFYPTKNLAALGDAGAVVTDDADLAERVRVLRQYGCRDRELPERLGVNSRMDEVQAALLRVALGRLGAWNERRRAAAVRYLEALHDLPDLAAPGWPEGAEPVWHAFAIQTDRRDALRAELARRGIGTLIHYPRAAADGAPFAAATAGAAPRARRAAGRVLSLPLHPHLAEGEQAAVIDGLRAWSAHRPA
jgi:dTDP-3-amino-3,4,6-trideoxy-alpha-D-glucose transaminase